MREAVVEAKLAVGETREAVARTERDLTQERQRLADAERRGRLASEIQDRETVEVAQRFAAKHRERAEVLAKKLAALQGELDRKSTRLNSSHLVISYAVFCLKK